MARDKATTDAGLRPPRVWVGGSLNVDWASLSVNPMAIAAPDFDPTTGTAFYPSAMASDGAFGVGFQLGVLRLEQKSGNFTALPGDVNGDGIADLIWGQLGGATDRIHTAPGKSDVRFEVTLAGQRTRPAATGVRRSPRSGM